MNPRVRPFAREPLFVLDGTQSAAFDRRAIEERGIGAEVLMERAGAGAAATIQALHPRGRVLILAGKGNNGGDGVVVARCLAAWGREVEVLTVGGRSAEDPLLHGLAVASSASDALDTPALLRTLEGPEVVVDAILGTGITGAPRHEAGRVIESLAGRPGPVVALDIPSGVDADTGGVPGAAVLADQTVSFGWPKLGTLLHPGRLHRGRLVVLEIGFPPLDEDLRHTHLLTPAWARVHRPIRDADAHKNRAGAVTLVAGKGGMAGAALLAGRAALRSGAGYVRLVTDPLNREIVQAALPEAVYVDASDPAAVDEALQAASAVAVGPGLGTDGRARGLLERTIELGRTGVVDADALNLLAGEDGVGPDSRLNPRWILTPHPGEAARLLASETGQVQADRPGALEALVARTDAVILLKGAPSMVGGPAGRGIDGVGSSDLATAGMGDTLTGAVAAFLAQGADPEVAAGLGLVTTGRAAALAARGVGLQAQDVPEHLPEALSEGQGETDLPLPSVLLDLDAAR